MKFMYSILKAFKKSCLIQKYSDFTSSMYIKFIDKSLQYLYIKITNIFNSVGRLRIVSIVGFKIVVTFFGDTIHLEPSLKTSSREKFKKKIHIKTMCLNFWTFKWTN